LGINGIEFWEVAESFRNPDTWARNESGEWKLKIEWI